MLDNLRNFGRSWVAKILLGVLIIAVAGFGIPSVFLDLNANTVARVGDKNISVLEFDRVYRAQVSQFAQQSGMTPSAQQAVSFGLPNSALARMANDASVEILAERLNLGASDAKLAQLVRQDPSFAGALGIFDSREFSAVLRQAGYTESEYIELQRDAAAREQVGMIFNGLEMPQVALDIARAYDNDQRTIEYVELNPVSFAVTQDPTEEELTQFFADSQERYRTEETRQVTILPLSAEALAAGVEVSEEDVAAAYERNAAQYERAETRTIHQLPLPDEAAVALFEAGLEDGSSFAGLVSEAGLQTEVTEIGALTEAEVTDPAVAEAAFGLEENGYTVIEGPEGARAIWVSAISEAGQQPLEAVRDEVEQALRLDRAQDLIDQAYDDIEEARAAFLPVQDVADQYGLELYEVALTRDGSQLAQIEGLPSGSTQPIVEAVFNASEEARVTPAINLGSNRTVFYELTEVQPARDQTLEEVRDQVVADWQDMRTEAAMTETAQDMVSTIDSGSDVFTVAAEQGQTPQTSSPFTRSSGATALNPDLAQAAFAGGEGYANYVTTQDGDIVVFQVTGVTPAAADAQSQVAQALETSFPDLLYASFVDGLRQDINVRINQEALNRVVGLE